MAYECEGHDARLGESDRDCQRSNFGLFHAKVSTKKCDIANLNALAKPPADRSEAKSLARRQYRARWQAGRAKTVIP